MTDFWSFTAFYDAFLASTNMYLEFVLQVKRVYIECINHQGGVLEPGCRTVKIDQHPGLKKYF